MYINSLGLSTRRELLVLVFEFQVWYTGEMRKPTDPVDSIRIPRIAVHASVANSVLEEMVKSSDLGTVTVFARANSYCSESFVDELVRLLFIDGYDRFEVHGASSVMKSELLKACSKWGGVTVAFSAPLP